MSNFEFTNLTIEQRVRMIKIMNLYIAVTKPKDYRLMWSEKCCKDSEEETTKFQEEIASDDIAFANLLYNFFVQLCWDFESPF